MPGMMKAARRRRHVAQQALTETDCPKPFFGPHILGTAWGSAKDKTPVLMFVLNASSEEVLRYVGELRKATLHVVKHQPYTALVAAKDGHSVGRLTTSLGSPLDAIVNVLESTGGRHIELALLCPQLEDTIPPLRLPVVLHDEFVDDLEPVEIGTGGYVCFCVNVHTGVAYAHRFETEEEALEQRARNEAEDRPFVGFDTFAN